MCHRALLRYHYYYDMCQSCTQDCIMSKFQRATESLSLLQPKFVIVLLK